MERRPAFFCHCEEGKRADGGPLRTAAPTKRRRWGCRGGYYPPGDCQKSLSLRGGQSPTWQSVTLVQQPPFDKGGCPLSHGFAVPAPPQGEPSPLRCHCEERSDVAIRPFVPTCLPLWGRCPVRTLGGEGQFAPPIPPNDTPLTKKHPLIVPVAQKVWV